MGLCRCSFLPSTSKSRIIPPAKPPGSHHHLPELIFYSELAISTPYNGFGCVQLEKWKINNVSTTYHRNAQQHKFRLYVVLQEGCAATGS
ncbi:hypothetical protein B0T20DRAFT_359572 [Sordaria brevicollis]|uniref:Uncharacterized protein n=1 Tax=Sordaria brevicollis TaxID=83679 RepID=A0AAE0P8V2_SORBR|nr:hypothetical protein B0T20DRAFT_359572 [Sordaria brevicollis]